MSAAWLARTLLLLAALFLIAALVLGRSPWPGVVLCGLALLPWGLGVWLSRHGATMTDEALTERTRVDALAALVNETHKMASAAHERIETQGEQISSLRNAASLRGTLGG